MISNTGIKYEETNFILYSLYYLQTQSIVSNMKYAVNGNQINKLLVCNHQRIGCHGRHDPCTNYILYIPKQKIPIQKKR